MVDLVSALASFWAAAEALARSCTAEVLPVTAEVSRNYGGSSEVVDHLLVLVVVRLRMVAAVQLARGLDPSAAVEVPAADISYVVDSLG